ncbi:MAG TPA: FAD binding domain-containing protein [Ilumatobacteraceae bacterium]|nr:FAD binding domain-containing protein [Ilumatobacteraceae bacterium]HRB03529.1 FAD binding domain-containing protein [Ilumatobacteraceae bacterium]
MSVIVPTSLHGALQALADTPDATVLAGGTDLMVELNSGHRHVASVIALSRIPELCSWSHDPIGGLLHIGAGITYDEIAREPLAQWAPALAQAARTVGSPQIRHAATIGGNVGTCSPAGDGLPVLSALDAVVHLASLSGTRAMPFADFMVGPKRTARVPGELITGVTVPVVRGWQGYSKVGVRNAMVIAVASAALVADTDAGTVRVALGSVGPTILRCPEAEAFAAANVDFATRTADQSVVEGFAHLVHDAARPIDDHRSSAAYRRHAVGVLAGRLLRRAFPDG